MRVAQLGREPLVILLQTGDLAAILYKYENQKHVTHERNNQSKRGKRKIRTSETYVDAEREGGICTSAGDTGACEYAEAEMGGGSLATLVMGGATMGDNDGAERGCGADAVAERVGVCASAGAEVGGAEEGAEAEIAPVSSETSLSETGLPEKNSPAVSEGSIEGAGGKMSDWKESD